MLEFQDDKLGNAAVVAVKGRIDNTSANLFEAHCDSLLRNGETMLVLDFTDLQFMSSAGLRAVLSLGKKTKAAGGKLVLACLQKPVMELFDLAGFSSMFPICPTLEEAAGQVL